VMLHFTKVVEEGGHSCLFSEGTRKAVLNQLKLKITPPNVIFIHLLIILDILQSNIDLKYSKPRAIVHQNSNFKDFQLLLISYQKYE
jgi:hypothetical protein